ncbi:hydroxymethylglutaryl-CoA lyase [Edwardsiella piscicida]|uniref:Pyruvate carboxyltransferase n=1 Tax=Edwardsiella tarda (strain FL6-60) TaxID=718251 RepID=A0A0H3DPM9_EDWTF|nr:pyruvate carboxyltransferase [Edwardsiella tarda FL6-60]
MTEQTRVNIVEIGPRDGFQNVRDFIPTALKIEIIEGIISAGVQRMQLTSFVSEAAIAQMRDAEIVSRHCISRYPDRRFSALVPNFHGARLAQACGYREITPVISLSETHNLKNVNKTHRQSLDEIARIRQRFPDLYIVQDIATVFGCPYEGRMTTPPLLALIAALTGEGIDEFTLCDTIGVAYPEQMLSTLNAVRSAFPTVRLNIHIHDTRNMGIINSYLAATWPVDAIQTSLGGLGGCPFAPGASGNTATEDLVYLLHAQGMATGIDFTHLLATAKHLHQHVQGSYSGHHLHISARQKDFTP